MTGTTLSQIVKKELKTYFFSPVAYIVIVVFLVVTGWFFFATFFLAGRADMRDFFSLLPIILAFFVPAITMRQFSEEFNTGSYEILYTLPVTTGEILMGKFISTLLFLFFMLLPTLSYPLFISGLGDLDWGPVLGGYLGALLLGGLYAGVGLFASSLTKNQIVAFIVAMALSFFLYFVDKVLVLLPNFLTGFFQFLGADYHFQNIAKGIIDSRDLVYFISITVLALYGSYLRIEER
jgi:ABC-2 type transport system permease protein